MPSLKDRAQGLLDGLRATMPWRAWTRYGDARGNVLAGGIAYFAFFSLFPALALGFTVFGLVLGGQEDLRRQVVEYVNTTLGADVVGLEPGSGVVALDQLVQGDVLTVAGAVGLAVLLLAGLGWIAAIREGVGAVFGRPGDTNAVVTKLRDLLVLGGLGIAVLVSVGVTLLVTTVTDPVVAGLGIPTGQGATVAVTAATTLALLLVDTVIFLVLFRVLPPVRPPLGDLLGGAVVGGVGLAVLKLFGGVLLRGSGSTNRFLAASSIVVGLLIWMNLVGRLTLLAAAWAATTASDRGHLPALAPPSGDLPGAADPVPARTVAGEPTYGRRAGELASVAAGAVLGAAAVLTAGALARAAASLIRARDGDGDGDHDPD